MLCPIWKEISRGYQRSSTWEPVSKSLKFWSRLRKSWDFKKKQKIKIGYSVCFLSNDAKKLKNVTCLKKKWKNWCFGKLQAVRFHFFGKIKNHHLRRISNAKTWIISEKHWFWWALGSVKTHFQRFLIFVAPKYFQSVIALTKIR